MSTECKIRIYKVRVKSVLICADQIRAETSRKKRLIRTTEMIVLRTIGGFSLRDRIRNGNTLREADKNRTE